MLGITLFLFIGCGNSGPDGDPLDSNYTIDTNISVEKSSVMNESEDKESEAPIVTDEDKKGDATETKTTTEASEQKPIVAQESSVAGDAVPYMMMSEASYNNKNILFAHGYKSSSKIWDNFTKISKNRGWKTYRTNVKGTIKERAKILAKYINSQNIENNSLVTVGHSMGGLDLRYIVNEGHKEQSNPDNIFVRAAMKISKVYTLATPHKGNQSASNDLGIKQMKKFNEDNPYVDFNINGRDIPLLAFRFSCDDSQISNGDDPKAENGSDGVVAVKRQILNGAPYTQSIFHGKHTAGTLCAYSKGGNTLEVELDHIIEGILDNKKYYTDRKDIIFYEGNECEGDEKGAFSSTYKKGTVECTSGDLCDNNEIRSLMIYPKIEPNTLIRLYNRSDSSYEDDWVRIHIGNLSLDSPVCIDSFNEKLDLDNVVMQRYRDEDDINVDGHISSIKITSSQHVEDPNNIFFYSDEKCEGELVGLFIGERYDDVNCKKSGLCANDKIASVKIKSNIEKNTIIKLYNDKDGDKFDDWTRIHIGEVDFDKEYCVRGLEHQTSSRDSAHNITIVYHKSDTLLGNGLNKKVSHVKIAKSTNKYDPDDIIFYDKGKCKGKIVGVFQSAKGAEDSCKEKKSCKDDAAKSLLIFPSTKDHTAIRIYNDPSGSRSDDYATLYRGSKDFDTPYCVEDFEEDRYDSKTGIKINYHAEDSGLFKGLNGKVSYIKIVPSSEMPQ